jgi:hypothetical protein
VTGEDEDHDRGKIFWPIKVGDRPDEDDAYATLYSLSDADLCLTFYDETGNIVTKDLYVEFMDIYADSEKEGTFARKTLKELLEQTLEIIEGDDETHSERVLRRLLQVLEEEE